MPAARNRGRSVRPGPSRVKITPVIAKNAPQPKQPRPKKEKPICAICLDDLDRKRVTRVSCGHRFHWTCMMNTLERMICSSKQKCPLCRASVECLARGQNQEQIVELYGRPQQPSLWYLHSAAKQYKETAGSIFKHCWNNTMIDLDRTRKQLESAKEMMKGADFVADIEDEISKLEQRKNILKEMKQMRQIWQLAASGGHVMILPIPKPARRVEWDYAYENRRAYGKAGDALRPHPPSIFSRSDTEASAHSSDEEANESDGDDIIPPGYWEEEMRYLPLHTASTPVASVQITAVSANRGVARPSSGASARPASGRLTASRAAPRTQVRRSTNARNRNQAALRAATLTSDDESDTEEQSVRTPRTRMTAAKEEEERAGVARRLRSRQH